MKTIGTIALSAAIFATSNAVSTRDAYLKRILAQKAPVYAKLGEKCEGFDETTGKYFPKCEENLECEM